MKRTYWEWESQLDENKIHKLLFKLWTVEKVKKLMPTHSAFYTEMICINSSAHAADLLARTHSYLCLFQPHTISVFVFGFLGVQSDMFFFILYVLA